MYMLCFTIIYAIKKKNLTLICNKKRPSQIFLDCSICLTFNLNLREISFSREKSFTEIRFDFFAFQICFYLFCLSCHKHPVVSSLIRIFLKLPIFSFDTVGCTDSLIFYSYLVLVSIL